MNEFVDRCRREWKRLGVADPLADEMAADLASDLADAEAEGVSAAEYFGSSAADPQSFAASWAAERGLVPASPGRRERGAPPALVAFTALAALTVVVAALLLATGEPKVALTSRTTGLHLAGPPGAGGGPGAARRVQASAAAPVEWVLLFVAVAAVAFCAWLWLRWRRARPPLVATAGGPARPGPGRA